MASLKEFETWLVSYMDKLSIYHDETVLEYINSIVSLEDDVSDMDEKKEGLTEFLQGITVPYLFFPRQWSF